MDQLSDESPCSYSQSSNVKNSLDLLYFWIPFTLIVIAAAAARVLEIDLRPFHNDEAVNHFFIKGMEKTGFYKYSHENYHGPTFFYLTYIFVQFFGESELAFRGSAILMGMLLFAPLIPLRKTEGNSFVLLAAALMAISGTLVFYSRYAIHETMFLFATWWLAVSIYLWWRTSKSVHLYTAGVSLAILVATKETFIISLFCLFFATLTLGDYRKKAAEFVKSESASLFVRRGNDTSRRGVFFGRFYVGRGTERNVSRCSSVGWAKYFGYRTF